MQVRKPKLGERYLYATPTETHTICAEENMAVARPVIVEELK